MANIEKYSLEDPDFDPSANDADGADGSSKPKGRPVWSAFLKTLLQPIEGWKALKRLHLTTQQLNSLLFFPAIAIAAVASFCSALFWKDLCVQEAIPMGLVTFCGFFFSYFLTLIFIKFLLPANCRDIFDTNFGKNYIATAMTSLALFDSLCLALPMLEPILVFLPVWTIFSICRGVKILGVPERHRAQTATIVSMLTLGLPWAMDWLMGNIF